MPPISLSAHLLDIPDSSQAPEDVGLGVTASRLALQCYHLAPTQPLLFGCDLETLSYN